MNDKSFHWFYFLLGAGLGFIISLSYSGYFWGRSSLLRWLVVAVVTLFLAMLCGIYGRTAWKQIIESRFVRWFWYTGG